MIRTSPSAMPPSRRARTSGAVGERFDEHVVIDLLSSGQARVLVDIQALGLRLRRVIAGHVSAAGVVLMSWLCVVSGMIAGCVRCAASAFRGSA